MSEPAVVEFNERYLWSLNQLSKAFGCARETVAARLHGLKPADKRRGFNVYHIADAARAILEAETPTFENIEDPDKLPPRDRLDWYKAENEKTKCLREAGDLIPAGDVAKEFARTVKACVMTLETLPDLLEMKCSVSPETVLVIESECDTARANLSNMLEEA